MIEHDYTLVCNYGSHSKTFKPTAIPKRLDDIVFVEAPNSSGKSTLLNILALAFYGHKRGNLQESLRTKILNLLEIKNNQLTFSIKINNKNAAETIEIKKKNPRTTDLEFIRTIKNGKPEILSSDRVVKDYELIYDIPVNPLDRLKELTTEIRARQQDIEKRVISIRTKIREYIVEIDAKKDIKLLGAHRREFNSNAGKIKAKKAERENGKKIVEKLKVFAYTKLFIFCVESLRRIKDELETIEKDITKVKKKGTKLSTRYHEIRDEIAEKKRAVIDLHKRTIATLRKVIVDKSEKGRLDLWAEMNVDDELDESPKKLLTHARHFKSTLQDIVTVYEKSQDSQIVNIFNDLLGVLNHYASTAVVLPGIDKSVPEIIKIIDDKFKIYKDKFHSTNLARECIEWLDTIIGTSEEICEELKPELKELGKEITKATGEEVDSEADVRIAELKRDQDQFIKSLDSCKAELKSLNIEPADVIKTLKEVIKSPLIEPFAKYDAQSLIDVILDYERRIDELQTEVRNLETNSKILESEIKRIETLKPHKYQAHKAILDDYHQVCIKLEQKLRRCNSYLTELNAGENEKIAADPEKMRYFDSVSLYLASIMKSIKHINKNYSVKKIDMVRREVVAEDGTVILFDFFGTGQSQSAYLKGLLSRSDKKKMIVLFDEISNMDTDSLRPVHDKISELYDKGTLIMALLVQKGDKTKVSSLTN